MSCLFIPLSITWYKPDSLVILDCLGIEQGVSVNMFAIYEVNFKNKHKGAQKGRFYLCPFVLIQLIEMFSLRAQIEPSLLCPFYGLEWWSPLWRWPQGHWRLWGFGPGGLSGGDWGGWGLGFWSGNMKTASVRCGHWQFCVATRRDILFILFWGIVLGLS